jgi:hypothetical protein
MRSELDCLDCIDINELDCSGRNSVSTTFEITAGSRSGIFLVGHD